MKLVPTDEGLVFVPNLSFVGNVRELRKIGRKNDETLYYNFQMKSTYNTWTSLDFVTRAEAEAVHASVLQTLEGTE